MQHLDLLPREFVDAYGVTQLMAGTFYYNGFIVDLRSSWKG